MGSNALGLDRGQLGASRIVKFIRSGPKILMLDPNYRFRADDGNLMPVGDDDCGFVVW